MLEKLTKLFLLAVAAVLVIAVTAVNPLAEPVRAHHKAGHGGGGNDGGDTNTNIDVDTTITDGNVLSSDSGGVYLDGVQNVTSEVTDAGKYKLNTNKTGKVGSGRTVFVDFGLATCTKVGGPDVGLPTFDDCGIPGQSCTESGIRTDDPANTNLHSLGPDESKTDAGFIAGLRQTTSDPDFGWRLTVNASQCSNICSGNECITVTRRGSTDAWDIHGGSEFCLETHQTKGGGSWTGTYECTVNSGGDAVSMCIQDPSQDHGANACP